MIYTTRARDQFRVIQCVVLSHLRTDKENNTAAHCKKKKKNASNIPGSIKLARHNNEGITLMTHFNILKRGDCRCAPLIIPRYPGAKCRRARAQQKTASRIIFVARIFFSSSCPPLFVVEKTALFRGREKGVEERCPQVVPDD